MKSQTKVRILLIEDEVYDVRRVKNTLKGHNNISICDVVSNGLDGLDKIKSNRNMYDVIIMDYQIAGGLHGLDLIHEIKKLDMTLQIIVITKMTINLLDFQFANQLLQGGAFWFCTKYPGDIEEYIYQPTDFIISILNAYEQRELERSKARIENKLERSIAGILQKKPIIGSSKVMKDLEEKIEKYKNTNATILIVGASGTGKELVATNIHYKSQLRDEAFVTVNCGSIPPDLIESELFGYEKGAFTGAKDSKKGLFEQANGGSIFLDEIGELPLSAQAKLLRVLQDGEIDKIGRSRKHKVNVRVIAATNINLEQAVKENFFRKDLYYRINVLRINVPSLRERPEDIPDLATYFIQFFCKDMSMKIPDVDKEAIKYLKSYSWPGNIREFKNVLQRVLFLSDKSITVENIKQSMGVPLYDQIDSELQLTQFFGESHDIQSYQDVLKSIKIEYFQYVRDLSSSDADAAKKMKLAPPNFHRMLKDLGLK